MSVQIVIPARLNSTRCPRKLLRPGADGRPLILHTARRAADTTFPVIIATDSEEILVACRREGFDVEMTNTCHTTGTQRVRELLPKIKTDWVLNWQGDEPDIDADEIVALYTIAQNFRNKAHIWTLAHRITDRNLARRSERVKVVADGIFQSPHFNGDILTASPARWFTRSLAPSWPGGHESQSWFIHCGVYLFNYDCLTKLQFPQKLATASENLEQLEWLMTGWDIMVLEGTGQPTRPIDTEADYEAWSSSSGL